jgi:glycosyltransferase involved in cell wall biosynthesis
LPSREDPYPLVCLEAACHGKPIVCFDGAGGMPEFVREDAGRVVPYLDAAQAGRGIVELGTDPALRAALGARGRERVVNESAIEIIGPQIAAQISGVLASRSERALQQGS